MATFGSIAKGTRARKRVKLPLAGARCNAETFEFEGDVVEVDLRALTPAEQSEVFSKARAFAIASSKVENPEDGDPLYDQAIILHTLVIACVDKDSPEDAPRPFFDGGFDQLHSTEQLSGDHIAYLYEQQKLWEDEVSPRLMHLTEAQFMAGVLLTASGDQRFFSNARRGTQWSLLRGAAARLVTLLAEKSLSGTGSASAGPSTKTADAPAAVSAVALPPEFPGDEPAESDVVIVDEPPPPPEDEPPPAPPTT